MIEKRGNMICAVSEEKDKSGKHRSFGCYSIAEFGLKGARRKAHVRLGQVEAFAKREG